MMDDVENSESAQPGYYVREAIRERLFMESMLYCYMSEVCGGQYLDPKLKRLRIAKAEAGAKELKFLRIK